MPYGHEKSVVSCDRRMNLSIDSAATFEAISPAASPPIPSATTNSCRSSALMKQSSLIGRTGPISLSPNASIPMSWTGLYGRAGKTRNTSLVERTEDEIHQIAWPLRACLINPNTLLARSSFRHYSDGHVGETAGELSRSEERRVGKEC